MAEGEGGLAAEIAKFMQGNDDDTTAGLDEPRPPSSPRSGGSGDEESEEEEDDLPPPVEDDDDPEEPKSPPKVAPPAFTPPTVSNIQSHPPSQNYSQQQNNSQDVNAALAEMQRRLDEMEQKLKQKDEEIVHLKKKKKLRKLKMHEALKKLAVLTGGGKSKTAPASSGKKPPRPGSAITRPGSTRGKNKVMPFAAAEGAGGTAAAPLLGGTNDPDDKDSADDGVRYRPLKGSTYPPSILPPIDPTAPTSTLELDFVHGYNGVVYRDNVWILGNGREVVYFIAATGVVYNMDTHRQRFFVEHDNDIMCLALHPDGHTVATGQQDPPGNRTPFVLIWDAYTMQQLMEIEGFHSRFICAVGFSLSGKRLVSIGGDDKHTLILFNWQEPAPAKEGGDDKRKVAECVTSGDHVWFVAFDPRDQGSMVVVGNKVVKYVWLADGVLQSKAARMGTLGKTQDFPCCAFGPEELYVGCADGDVYILQGRVVVSKFKAHKGCVGGIFVTPSDVPGILATTGGDGKVILWDKDESGKWVNAESVQLASGIEGDTGKIKGRTLHTLNGAEFVVGTMGNEIYLATMILGDDADGVCRLLVAGNAAEVWGLDTHPSKPEFTTAADDMTIRVWDMDTRLQIGLLMAPAEAKCVSYRGDGQHVAVGMGDGTISIYDWNTKQVILRKEDRWEYIKNMQYSPDMKYLAVGSGENTIDLYEVEEGYRRVAVLRGHSSYIVALDWSADSKMLRTCSGDYELLHWWIESRKLEGYASYLRDVVWESQNVILGWPVIGIWPEGSDGTDVNCTARNNSGYDVVATADDFGNVKLFNWPVCVEDSECNTYNGHCSHVTAVEFSFDDRFLISAGGGDMGIFQWKFNKVPRRRRAPKVIMDDTGKPKVLRKPPNPRTGRAPKPTEGHLSHPMDWK